MRSYCEHGRLTLLGFNTELSVYGDNRSSLLVAGDTYSIKVLASWTHLSAFSPCFVRSDLFCGLAPEVSQNEHFSDLTALQFLNMKMMVFK